MTHIQEEEERLKARLSKMSDYQSYDFSFKASVVDAFLIQKPSAFLSQSSSLFQII